jgi:phytoene synthase
LTNILRDVVEDAQRDRVYLPADQFDLFELSPLAFTMAKVDESIVKGIAEMAECAKDYYEKSAELDRLVHADGRACLWAMTKIYRGLLDKILARPRRVFDQRVRLSSLHKALIALRATLGVTGGKR